MLEGVVLAAAQGQGTSFTLPQRTALPALVSLLPLCFTLPTLLPNKQPIPNVMDALELVDLRSTNSTNSQGLI